MPVKFNGEAVLEKLAKLWRLRSWHTISLTMICVKVCPPTWTLTSTGGSVKPADAYCCIRPALLTIKKPMNSNPQVMCYLHDRGKLHAFYFTVAKFASQLLA